MSIGRRSPLIPLLITAGLLFSCAGPGTVSLPPSTEHATSTSQAKRPLWVSDPVLFQRAHPTRVIATGGSDRKTDMEDGRETSLRQATDRMATIIRSGVRQKLREAAGQDPGVSSKKNLEAVSRILDARPIHGLSVLPPAEIWWRKYWVQNSPEAPVRYLYDVFTLLSISPARYNREVDQTLSRLLDEVRTPAMKALVRKAIHPPGEGVAR